MFGALLGIVESVLHIWAKKLDRKYIDKVVELKSAYYAEVNKPEADRSDAILDNLKFELRLVTAALTADLKQIGPL